MSRAERPNVVFVLPDKVGGVFSFCESLLAQRQADLFDYTAILTDNVLDDGQRAIGALSADSCRTVTYASPTENLYAYLRRLRRAIPAGGGALVCNDWLELAMVSAYRVDKAVINVSHADADYYYRLAVRHEASIDCFVAITKQIEQRLLELLPHRRGDIVLLPFGVAIPAATRRPPGAKLRLLYVGRLDKDKGVMDLPAIDRLLVDSRCSAEWTIQGSGPLESELKAAWKNGNPVVFRGAKPHEEVLPLYLEHDVFVLPSRSEGLPITLLEAGAAGCVPVVSDLQSGIREVIEPGITGFAPPVGDVRSFAAAIVHLDRDRDLLESMSRGSRARIEMDFNAAENTLAYENLFARWRELKRPSRTTLMYYGSRLDKKWLPNFFVRTIREMGRRKRSAGS